jgi:phage terminase large subunit
MVPHTAQPPNLIREFKNYKWKEDQAGKATNEPIDKFNHGITFGETASLS